MRGVNSLAKHPERVGTGPKDKKRLQIQLTWQNWPNPPERVPPLPGAREGRGSLELVEIFQMRIVTKQITPVCRSRCGARGADRSPGAGTTPHPPIPPPSLLSVLRTGVLVCMSCISNAFKFSGWRPIWARSRPIGILYV